MVEAVRPYLWDIDNPEGYANAMGRYKTGRESAFIRASLAATGLRVLDVGGGSGRFAVPLAEAGHHLTVVDVSGEAVDMLRRRRHPNIEALHADFATFDAPSRFDAVIAIESVQYFPQVALADLFARVGGLLRAGGVFAFTGLNKRSWRFGLHALRRNKPTYNASTPGGYFTALRQAGFSVSVAQGFMWMPFPVSSNSPLVPAFASIERRFGLGRWLDQSPWVLVAARYDGRSDPVAGRPPAASLAEGRR
jgi:SAM-dependent methyltransferase